MFKHKNYILPNRDKTSNELLNNLFKKCTIAVKNEIQQTEAISITTDGWTSVQNYSYLGVICHCIDQNFKLKNFFNIWF